MLPGDSRALYTLRVVSTAVVPCDSAADSLAAADVIIEMEGMNFTDVMRQNQSQLVLGSKVCGRGVGRGRGVELAEQDGIGEDGPVRAEREGWDGTEHGNVWCPWLG